MALVNKNKPVVNTKEPELPAVFNDSEFTKPADRLVQAVRRHYRVIEGYNVDEKELLNTLTKLLETRL